jgi:hypothetical protein
MQEKKPINSIAAGALLGAVLIVMSEITMAVQGNKVSGERPTSSWIVYIIIIGALIFFINQYAKANDNTLTFGNLFVYGFKITAVFVVMNFVYMLVFQYIHPDFKQAAMEAARLEMEKQKNAEDKQIETTMDFMDKYFWVIAIAASTFGNLVLGVIGSLIGAAIPKKGKKNQMKQLDHLDQPNS